MELRVRGGIAVDLASVVSTCEDRAVPNDDGADGHLAHRGRPTRDVECFPHVPPIEVVTGRKKSGQRASQRGSPGT
jgi:hypothetical protein